ncbi:queuosine-tRNA galactosyltransferase isoform X2 [Arvicanthis niloticus]|uniref:queuosine-tRNA galactosyltransferase isoform X2 n=1 Tax=Arvicanthis niloticus TaxID=61156 RepID=UPI00402BE5C4
MQLPEDATMRAPLALVSIILPVHNAEQWLDECLMSVLQQDFEGTMELSVFNDASKDKSTAIIEKWKVKLEDSGISVVIGGHDSPSPRGVGYSKNQAVAQSSGSYLCFLDSDDVMMPQRVRMQYEAAVQHPTSIIGCQVRRDPPDSTERYTRWINQLTSDQLLTQVFTSHGPTVIMPTWFCSRTWFSHVGPFDEGGQGVPEDLLFFYEHLRKGGGVFRVDHSLLLYRYHLYAATHSVLECCWSLAIPSGSRPTPPPTTLTPRTPMSWCSAESVMFHRLPRKFQKLTHTSPGKPVPLDIDLNL